MEEAYLIAANTLKKYGIYLFLAGVIIGAMVAHKQKINSKTEKIEIRQTNFEQQGCSQAQSPCLNF